MKRKHSTTAAIFYALVLQCSGSFGFVTDRHSVQRHCGQCSFPKIVRSEQDPRCAPHLSLSLAPSAEDSALASWVLAFSLSHIGMSAIRSSIIARLGHLASSPPLSLVGREEWKLPRWWPGDSSGGDQVFPDADTAGRQIYRAGYTSVSFLTLGSALAAYLSASVADTPLPLGTTWNAVCIAVAALSLGASGASLFNASPLGLMPGFEAASGETGGSVKMTPESSPVGLRRDDVIKFKVRGLTRITRHPLILPVMPWGIATSYLAGGRSCDFILFAGLSAYAVAGCAAQDLRVSKKEGSVGTVFRPRNSSEEGDMLATFFKQTSFVPFGAVLDGRQQLTDILREVPWIAFVVGTGFGVYEEQKILEILQEWAVR